MGQSRLKLEEKLEVVDVNLGVKKEQVELVQVPIDHLYGKVVVLFLAQNQKLFYNKRNNILVIDNLENLVELPKTRIFSDFCKKCDIDLNQKILIIVSKKTELLKLSTRNLKNVELILASNLNTLCLLKAKQILLTPLAVNDIKETYCD